MIDSQRPWAQTLTIVRGAVLAPLLFAVEGYEMAKGQMRSNKEVKKPKKDKSKPAELAAGATMGARFAAAADKNKDAKK